MARDFHERFQISRDVFSEASDALGFDVAKLCFEEDDPRLDLTEFTQAAILTAEIAMIRALHQELGIAPQVFGGHSLGEYSALCAAGAIPLAIAVRLVRKRGELMQAAVPLGKGAMVAVLGEGIATTAALRPALEGLEVDVANLNSKNQIVLSGLASDMDRACARVREAAGAPVELVPLAVSAPFHSRHMRVIEPEFRGLLESVGSNLAPVHARRVTANFTGGFHTGELEPLIDSLTRQISGPVDWIANMDALGKIADRIVEVGPNRPLRGFFKTTGREIASIISIKTAEKALAS
jgi:malonyl CoA-acyl carrier protein transacylase